MAAWGRAFSTKTTTSGVFVLRNTGRMSIHRSSQPGLERTRRIGSPGLVAHGSHPFCPPRLKLCYPYTTQVILSKVETPLWGLITIWFYTHEYPCTYYFILWKLNQISTNKVRNQLRLIHSRTLDAELTFQCTRPVTYQIQEVAGELFESEDFASHLWRLRVCFSNRFRPEIQKKPNLYK